ncbi:dihydroorotase [Caldanaerovirga acetigignens]|uniref:Dihydroorotase n=1 Tax=Caldanaerovirga acetigignens TaxID=447595 RepID=A0A1M7M075_9FIRM|nr:dihydroorotase [Caldanaerovirga acetigignens]SHM84019.1 dihydroorotase [Caldanaerovirga acetigignens]
MKVLLKGARVLDPSRGLDGIMDVLIEGERIAMIGENLKDEDAKVIDLSGLLLVPGFVDMHVHLRDPGLEYKEDIESGAKSAAAGGFTAVACMPNTVPPVDNAALVSYILSKGQKAGFSRVLPIGCISKGREGKELAEIGEMASAGAVAFSDDGNCISDASLMRRALMYAGDFGKVVIDHCEDPALSAGGVMNEGYVSTLLGLPGIPRSAEEVMVARDVILANETGARVHIAHVSTKGSVEIIRKAKAQGIPVTCEVAPHHLVLTEDAVMGYNTNAKVNPPLRTEEDVEALIEGLKDGTIDAIASDHAPHSMDEKDVEFDKAAFGISGLETSLGLILTFLVGQGKLSLEEAVKKMSVNPARILGIEGGSLKEKAPADITVIDLNKRWTVESDKFFSKGKNTPFEGWELKGKAVMTIVRGKIVYAEKQY